MYLEEDRNFITIFITYLDSPKCNSFIEYIIGIFFLVHVYYPFLLNLFEINQHGVDGYFLCQGQTKKKKKIIMIFLSFIDNYRQRFFMDSVIGKYVNIVLTY